MTKKYSDTLKNNGLKEICVVYVEGRRGKSGNSL